MIDSFEIIIKYLPSHDILQSLIILWKSIVSLAIYNPLLLFFQKLGPGKIQMFHQHIQNISWPWKFQRRNKTKDRIRCLQLLSPQTKTSFETFLFWKIFVSTTKLKIICKFYPIWSRSSPFRVWFHIMNRKASICENTQKIVVVHRS